VETAWSDDTLTVYIGDCRAVMAELEPESVHCVVTSPPYWGLRDYGVPGQLGLEPTPEEYVANMVGVFREVRRVLRDDGTVWLNLGDSYATGAGKASSPGGGRMPLPGLKPKDLVGIPWRVAFALQADGWYLRSDIIWAKPNPMPESVTDRPTKAHEYLFLLTKSARYHYDAEAVREPAQDWSVGGPGRGIAATTHYHPDNGGNEGLGKLAARYKAARRHGVPDGWATGPGSHSTVDHSTRDRNNGPTETVPVVKAGRNIRSVWTIATQPYPGAHFATFPEKLVEPCVKAGSPPDGVVLDPFAGSGTVGRVANRLGRRAILIDLSADYIDQAMLRNAQAPLGIGA
jgi:DNA modification methylase